MPRLFLSAALAASLLCALPAARPAQAVMPTRAGTVPSQVSRAFDQGLFKLPPVPHLRTSATGMNWKIPVILVDFTDQPLTFASPSDWNRALFDTTGTTPTGSIFDYYRWVSGQRIRVVGEVVATVHLDNPKAYYAFNSWGLSQSTPQNSYGVVDRALRTCSSSVDWSRFDRDLDGYVDMVWVVHSGLGGEHVVSRQDLWSITSRLTQWAGGSIFDTSDLLPGTSLHERIDAFSILPEMSAFHPGQRSEIGVYCHEFGHALGLPDLYDTAPQTSARNVGPGNWSLMSTGAYGGDGRSPEYPAHLGAWPLLFLGWGRTVRPTQDGTMSLAPLERGGNILEAWFQGEGSPEHFLIEYRHREGFDRNLPGDGLLVYQVNDIRIQSTLASNLVNVGPQPGLRVIEGDGNHELMTGGSRGSASDPFPGSTPLLRWDDDTSPSTRSIEGNVTHIALYDMAVRGDSMGFFLQVRSPGWQSPHAQSESGFVPVLGPGPGMSAVSLEDSSIVAVTSEYAGGRPQVVLRSRRPDLRWEPALQLSASPGAATEPSIAALPGGDLCVVWSDSRDGPNELYFRSRVLGVWTPEQRLTNLSGYSLRPALGADPRGGVHVSWLYNDGIQTWVYFLYFTYLTPFGDPIPVTRIGERPDSPAIAVARDGSSYVLWSDRTTSPITLWFSHFAPDSGLRPAHQLISTVEGTQTAVNGVVDPFGRLHYIYQISGSSGIEIRYQWRGAATSYDTTLIRRGESMQHASLAVAQDGSLHLVTEAAYAGGTQILYKEWRRDGGWDVGSTEVTQTSDGNATRPTVLPRRSGAMTMLYILYSGGSRAFIERDRGQLQQQVTAVPDIRPGEGATWQILPNPLRPGGSLRLSREGSEPAGKRLEVFDLSGRRVAAAEVRREGERWTAEIPAARTGVWPSGVYFARVRGETTRARIVVLR